MATLKEAVESGRRWRWKGEPWWRAAGFGLDSTSWTTFQALSSHFEIEPEPEKPREWTLPLYGSDIHCSGCKMSSEGFRTIRVHDADACDQLHSGCRNANTPCAG